MLTELEGAILSEIFHRGQKTAFQVRRAFAASFSLEWKGSAGSVYPAVKRLVARGFISASEPVGARGTQYLTLSKAGEAELMTWALDTSRAASIGIDPFRLRSGIWLSLGKKKRETFLRNLVETLEESIPHLEAFICETDSIERARVELGVAVQRSRLELIRHWLKSENDKGI